VVGRPGQEGGLTNYQGGEKTIARLPVNKKRGKMLSSRSRLDAVDGKRGGGGGRLLVKVVPARQKRNEPLTRKSVFVRRTGTAGKKREAFSRKRGRKEIGWPQRGEAFPLNRIKRNKEKCLPVWVGRGDVLGGGSLGKEGRGGRKAVPNHLPLRTKRGKGQRGEAPSTPRGEKGWFSSVDAVPFHHQKGRKRGDEKYCKKRPGRTISGKKVSSKGGEDSPLPFEDSKKGGEEEDISGGVDGGINFHMKKKGGGKNIHPVGEQWAETFSSPSRGREERMMG